MRILFNAYRCGLGNNGGTKTIIRSAEALQELGHEIVIVAQINHYSWHKPTIDIVSTIDGDFDATIRVSVWDDGLPWNTKAKKHVWWLRGWEKWVFGESELVWKLENWQGDIICNAGHLVDKLKQYNIEAQLCYAGLDLDYWKDYGKPRDKIGGLINKRHDTKQSAMVGDICDIYADGNKSQAEMEVLYNACKIWLSPSTNEGFHQCPAEAALCGCLVIGYRGASGGTRDWLSDKTGYLFETVQEAREIINGELDYSKVDKAKAVLREKIGDRRTNMQEMVGLLS